MNKRHFNSRKKVKHSLTDKILIAVCVLCGIAFLFIFAYPVIYVLISSISTDAMRTGVSLIPNEISFDGYKEVLTDPTVQQGFINSVVYTVTGTLVSLTCTVFFAYVLSRPTFKGAKLITVMLMITLYLSGGMIPTYLVVKKLGLLNTMWALILPSCISVYNIFLLRSYFTNKIPAELYDAAVIDGCGHWCFLVRVVLPMSSSFLMVIALFFVSSYWNSYFMASIYITDLDKLPLANVLNNILIRNQDSSLTSGLLNSGSNINAEQTKQLVEYALIVVSSLPVISFFIVTRKHIGKDYAAGSVKM